MSPFTTMIPTVLILILHTHSQSLYILQQELLTWDASEASCLFNYDTNLASIHGTTDGIDATTTANANEPWIGLHDINTEAEWIWTDGTAWDYGTTFFEAPWNTVQPDNFNSDEDCVHIIPDGKWNDRPCTDGRYALCGYPEPIPIMDDPSNYLRIPAYNNTIGIVDVLDEIHIEFDIIFTSFPATGRYGSILQIGDLADQRLPAIFVFEGQHFHSTFSTITEWNNVFNSNNLGNLNLGVSYHYMLHQTQDSMQITVNGAAVYNGYIDSHSIIFNRKLCLGNEWNFGGALFDSQVTNLYITTSNSHLPNGFNYNCDGTKRWTEISGTWIFDDNACTVTQTDDALEGAVVWLGTADTSSIDWTDYKIEVKFNIVSAAGEREVGILVRSQTVSATNNYGKQYSFSCVYESFGQPDRVQLSIKNDGSTFVTLQEITLNANTDYILRVEATGNTFNVYWNNEFVFTVQNNLFSFGSIGLRTWNAHAIFTSVRITFPSDNHLYTTAPTTAPTTSFPTTATPTTISPTAGPITAAPTTIQPTKPPTKNPTNMPSIPPTTKQSVAPTTTSPSTSEPSTAPTTYEPTATPTRDGRSAETTNVESTVAAEHNEGDQPSVLDAITSDGLLLIVFSMCCFFLLLLLCLCLFVFWKKRAFKKQEAGGINLEIAKVKSTSAMSSSSFGEDGGENETNITHHTLQHPVAMLLPMGGNMNMNMNVMGVNGMMSMPPVNMMGAMAMNMHMNMSMNMENRNEGNDEDEMGSNKPLPMPQFDENSETDEEDDADNLYESGVQSPGAPETRQ